MSDGNQLDELLEAAAPAPAAAEFEFGTLPPEISFQTERVPPPAWLYVERGDRLLLQVWNSTPDVRVDLSMRLLLPNGEVSPNYYQFMPTADRALTMWYIPLTEAFLISVTIFPAIVSVPAGSCWVRCMLVHGAGSGQLYPQGIAGGYIARGCVLSWPYPRFQNPVEGPGHLRLIEGTDPAPGVSIAETVPVGARWKLVSVFCWLATSAAAGDRHVYLELMSPAGVWLWIPPALAQPASFTYYYTWAIGINPYTSSIVGLVARPLPDQLTLTPGQQFLVQCTGILAGDDFGPPRYLVEEWVEP